MLHHLAGATIKIANLVNYICQPSRGINHSSPLLCSNNFGISHLLCAYDQAVSLHNNGYIYYKEYSTFIAQPQTPRMPFTVYCEISPNKIS